MACHLIDPIFPSDPGFRNGDKILAVDDKPVEDFTDAVQTDRRRDKDVTIERNGIQHATGDATGPDRQ